MNEFELSERLSGVKQVRQIALECSRRFHPGPAGWHYDPFYR
jgi:hypothetical protein